MGVLVSGLIGRGFTRDQAERFLPEAGGSVISTIDGNSGSDVESIIGSMDIERIAASIAIESLMISKGPKYIIPVLMDQVVGNNMGSLLGKVKSFCQVFL